MLVNDFTNIIHECEKRKTQRYKLIYCPEVFNNDTNELIGYIDDISLQGAMVISYKYFTVRDIFNVRLSFPQGKYSVNYLDIEVACVRCYQDINPDYFNIGLLFNNISSSEQEIISYFIDDYQF